MSRPQFAGYWTVFVVVACAFMADSFPEFSFLLLLAAGGAIVGGAGLYLMETGR